MQKGKWSFTPSILPAVAALATFSLLLVLGFWQLDRADQKVALYEKFLEKSELDPVHLNQELFPDNLEKLQWRRSYVSGYYVEGRLFLLDNQVLGGEPGYFVFSPFAIAGTGRRVMVNRGWVPAGYYRDTLPDIHTPEGTLILEGVLAPPPATGLLLGGGVEEKMEMGVSRMQNIDLKVLEAILGYKLLPYVIQLGPSAPGGYTREWGMPGSGAERHHGYAFQWFALAAALLVIYFSTTIRIHNEHE